MLKQIIKPGRGTNLKQNGKKNLKISLKADNLNNIFLINGEKFITENLTQKDLIINPNQYYMLINRKDEIIKLKYSYDISEHKIIYNPYKYENSEKIPLNPQEFILHHNVPEGYIDILPKWYSIKFTYPDFNLIYIKPETGISIQIHENRSEIWEILKGNPIIVNGNRIYYFVNKSEKFENRIRTYHSVINPNKESNNYVLIKEEWKGIFDENDIKRIYNPNNYH